MSRLQNRQEGENKKKWDKWKSDYTKLLYQSSYSIFKYNTYFMMRPVFIRRRNVFGQVRYNAYYTDTHKGKRWYIDEYDDWLMLLLTRDDRCIGVWSPSPCETPTYDIEYVRYCNWCNETSGGGREGDQLVEVVYTHDELHSVGNVPDHAIGVLSLEDDLLDP